MGYCVCFTQKLGPSMSTRLSCPCTQGWPLPCADPQTTLNLSRLYLTGFVIPTSQMSKLRPD